LRVVAHRAVPEAEARSDGLTEEVQADWLALVAECCSGSALVPLAGQQDGCLDGQLAVVRSAPLLLVDSPLPEADWLARVAECCSGSPGVPSDDPLGDSPAARRLVPRAYSL
jgi:hypothetical protein